jgi:hypothetical protein
MPTSHSGQINTIVEIITEINPSSILDIGVGYGKYGFLSREYLDISNNKDQYNSRRVIIHGIEGFPEYITDLQRMIYDDIFIGDALQVVDKLEKQYDLILLMDVFEHFSYDDGLALLKKLTAKGKYVLISTPKLMSEQGAEFGNVYETHRFEWKKRHFDFLADKTFFQNYYSTICLIGKNASSIKQAIRNKFLKVKLVVTLPWLQKIYFKFKNIIGRK